MNKRIKKEWVKRLMSGEYAQGREYLRAGDRYCCLGVLQTILSIQHLLPDARVLLTEQLEAAGLTMDEQRALTLLNDAYVDNAPASVPFPVIAGFIQENL